MKQLGGNMDEETKDFIIKDKRIFSEDRTEDAEDKDQEKPEDESTESPTEEQKAADAKTDDEKYEEQDYALPEINFPTFIFSLNSSALVHLGVIEDPATNQKNRNLPMAKQTIDILGMIEEKTKGNLTEDEANMLQHILYELRMIYVKEQG
jgi:hypothetical protein